MYVGRVNVGYTQLYGYRLIWKYDAPMRIILIDLPLVLLRSIGYGNC